MPTHAQIWAALDRLAALAGLSPSGLAKKAGLDPTTFNKSKRITPDGGRAGPRPSRSRSRWPRPAAASKLRPADRREGAPPGQGVPLIGFAQAGRDGYFDDAGFPAGKGWDEIRFRRSTTSMPTRSRSPAIDGAGLSRRHHHLVSPAASIRRGDRVVVKTREGEVMVKELKRRTAKTVELRSINTEHGDRSLPVRDVEWIARVMWASQ